MFGSHFILLRVSVVFDDTACAFTRDREVGFDRYGNHLYGIRFFSAFSDREKNPLNYKLSNGYRANVIY